MKTLGKDFKKENRLSQIPIKYGKGFMLKDEGIGLKDIATDLFLSIDNNSTLQPADIRKLVNSRNKFGNEGIIMSRTWYGENRFWGLDLNNNVIYPYQLEEEIPYTTVSEIELETATGYGENTTGGFLGEHIQVNSREELIAALSIKKPVVVLINSPIEFEENIILDGITDKTILGTNPNAKFITKVLAKKGSGILHLKQSKNIIIRNITFIGPGAFDCDGDDLLCFDGVRNAWVDHCDFQDGIDENFGIKRNSNFITISWCRFRYLMPPIPAEGSGVKDHRFSNLVGMSTNDHPEEGDYLITLLWCWWDDGCTERMVRARNSHLHFINCYWGSPDAIYYIGAENTDALIEGCVFEDLKYRSQIFNAGFHLLGSSSGDEYNDSYVKTEGGNVFLEKTKHSRVVIHPKYNYNKLHSSLTESIIRERGGV